MHHLPRMFSPSKRKASRMNARKPRLDRRNAAKNFDYDATESPSSARESSLHTRSLDLSSFRVEGCDGELELIYRSLGLSGPEDFAIPADVWEASKQRSVSDRLPRSELSLLDSSKVEEAERAVVDELADRVVNCVRIEGEGRLEENGRAELDRESVFGEGFIGRGGELGQSRSDGSVVCSMGSGGSGSGGIKGIRPPMLKPPPGMMVGNIDSGVSTWDLLKAFGPGDKGSACGDYDGSSEEEAEGEVHGENVKGEEVENVLRIKETGMLSGGCSFSTTADDDSSSTTTEPRSNNISPSEKYGRIITNWQKGDVLGSGSFGTVYEGYSDDGSFFAIKEVSLIDQGSHERQSLEQEIALLSQFKHENIVRYYGTGKDESKLYIFLELANKGSLASLYKKYTLKDSQVSGYTRQILLGLKYLHDRRVVHRDIKCANLLLDSTGSVKLADFGLAKAVRLNDIKSCKGTAFWMAPEVVRGKGQGYGLPADIWSLGCTVLEMLTGHFPYYPLECVPAMFRIGKGEPPPIPDSLSKEAQDFTMQCLRRNPDDRPTAAELLNHPFVRATFPASPDIGQQQ